MQANGLTPHLLVEKSTLLSTILYLNKSNRYIWFHDLDEIFQADWVNISYYKVVARYLHCKIKCKQGCIGNVQNWISGNSMTNSSLVVCKHAWYFIYTFKSFRLESKYISDVILLIWSSHAAHFLLKPLCHKSSCDIEDSTQLQSKLVRGLIPHHSMKSMVEVL